MTITLELPPELEHRLLSEAKAKGVPVGDVVKAYLIHQASPATTPEELSAAQWEKEFEEWLDSATDMPTLSDEAISRESIYTREDEWR